MAYSDYGGYAYRNGKRVLERSDAVLSSEGLKSTPGMWPGFVLPEARSVGSYHVIMGDGPVHVTLYKQSSLGILVNGDEQDELAVCTIKDVPAWEYKDSKGIDVDVFKDSNEVCTFEVADHKIEVFWRDDEDNHYQYVRLTQPDGNTWLGFSGYGVGAGFEDGDYGYSNADREGTLFELFA